MLITILFTLMVFSATGDNLKLTLVLGFSIVTIILLRIEDHLRGF